MIGSEKLRKKHPCYLYRRKQRNKCNYRLNVFIKKDFELDPSFSSFEIDQKNNEIISEDPKTLRPHITKQNAFKSTLWSLVVQEVKQIKRI